MALVWKRRPKKYDLFKTEIEVGQVTPVVDSAAGESRRVQGTSSQEPRAGVSVLFSAMWLWASQAMDTVCSFFTWKLGVHFFFLKRYS